MSFYRKLYVALLFFMMRLQLLALKIKVLTIHRFRKFNTNLLHTLQRDGIHSV